MSRFDKYMVQRDWAHKRQPSGIMKATGLENGIEKSVWVSDIIEPGETAPPVMGRYLLNYGSPVIVKQFFIKMNPLWVTLDQFRKLLKAAGRTWEARGIEALIHIIAKVLDKLAVKVSDSKVGQNVIIQEVMKVAKKKISSEFLTEKQIKALLVNIHW